MQEIFDIFIYSYRDGFVQVSAFVAFTVLLFSFIQYKTGGKLVRFLENNRHFQPFAGVLLGLTPGCGGAIIIMPLYVRGSVSFGTVVATLVATAGDAAFVVLTQAPEAAIYAYGLAAISGLLFGYAIDWWGLGVGRLDRAVQQLGDSFYQDSDANRGSKNDENSNVTTKDSNPENPPSTQTSFLHTLTEIIHFLWWIVAVTGLIAGVDYLRRGAPDVEFAFGLSFPAIFTISGVVGTTLSLYLFFIGKRAIGKDLTGHIHFMTSSLSPFRQAAMETSMVTVWVITAYLIYEYSMLIFSFDIGAIAAAAGIWAPVAGAGLGLVPGCGPQIIFATLYADSQIPFSALVANTISQDGDALFPLMAIDMKAAIIASLYTTIPALIVGFLVYYFWPYASFGFGVLN
jgi:hypothetical protein